MLPEEVTQRMFEMPQADGEAWLVSDVSSFESCVRDPRRHYTARVMCAADPEAASLIEWYSRSVGTCVVFKMRDGTLTTGMGDTIRASGEYITSVGNYIANLTIQTSSIFTATHRAGQRALMPGISSAYGPICGPDEPTTWMLWWLRSERPACVEGDDSIFRVPRRWIRSVVDAAKARGVKVTAEVGEGPGDGKFCGNDAVETDDGHIQVMKDPVSILAKATTIMGANPESRVHDLPLQVAKCMSYGMKYARVPIAGEFCRGVVMHNRPIADLIIAQYPTPAASCSGPIKAAVAWWVNQGRERELPPPSLAWMADVGKGGVAALEWVHSHTGLPREAVVSAVARIGQSFAGAALTGALHIIYVPELFNDAMKAMHSTTVSFVEDKREKIRQKWEAAVTEERRQAVVRRVVAVREWASKWGEWLVALVYPAVMMLGMVGSLMMFGFMTWSGVAVVASLLMHMVSIFLAAVVAYVVLGMSWAHSMTLARVLVNGAFLIALPRWSKVCLAVYAGLPRGASWVRFWRKTIPSGPQAEGFPNTMAELAAATAPREGPSSLSQAVDDAKSTVGRKAVGAVAALTAHVLRH